MNVETAWKQHTDHCTTFACPCDVELEGGASRILTHGCDRDSMKRLFETGFKAGREVEK
jgi:hypothetical protein